MLRLLQNKLSSRSLFFRDIIFFVTFLHVVVIGLFFIIGFLQNKNEKFTVRSQSQLNSTIVFLPLKKYVDPKMNATNKKGSLQKYQSRKVMDYQTYLQKKKQSAGSGKVVSKTVTKTVAKKIPNKSKISKKNVKKSIAKKNVVNQQSLSKRPIVDKKKIQKKSISQKKLKEKPVDAKKSEELKKEKESVEEEKEQTVQKIKKDVSSKKVDLEKIEEVAVEAAPTQEIIVDDQKVEGAENLGDVIFVGYRELEALELQGKVQLAVEQCWSPPVGMPNNTTCELQVTIENQGEVVGAKVVKSSQIVAFDLAARSAIYKTKFPQNVWGKQITVELGI